MSAIELTLGTNNSALKTGLDQARNQVENFKSQAHHILMGLFAGVGIEQLIEHFSHLQDMAETFSTTAEAVQRVDQYAQQFGTSVDGVAKALAKLRSDGGDKLAKLGIDAKEFAAAEMDQQLIMIAEALEQVTDPQERVNRAFEIFGPRLKEVLPILLAGGEAMKEFFGGAAVASNETVATLDAAGDKLTELKNITTVAAAYIFSGIDKFVKSIANGMSSAFSIVVNGVGRAGEALSALGRGDFKGVKTAMSAGLDDMKTRASMAMQDLGEIWKGGLVPTRNKKLDKMDGSSDDVAGGGKERLSLAERLKALQEDHDRKQLDTAVRLKQLAEERAMLEIKLFATQADEAERKKTLEDQLVANRKETLSLEDRAAKDQEAAAEKVAKAKESAEKNAALAAQKAIRDKERSEEKAMKDAFAEREKNLGFVSGMKVAGSDQGQQLAGVNYDVINGEAEKGLQLQIEMRNYLKSIDEKKWSVELPDAS